ncbi:GNAT family N-acetyltransferase [Evansella tamaricis]|uniref:GNAT family N-acetyltransferase n=1 Tax=Evansella tamaricis TaxID=2069301 RepID=A0ABS6JB17_9BACI|nr:GNAT family N-acetyltransferase [Evansella tamaricis]MBU9710871.1 GNAT family N-acetyltransferase [Evansella tamaricis]
MKDTIHIRQYEIKDFEKLLTIQKEAFPPPFPEELWWSKEQIQAHVNTFPKGAMLAEWNGEPAGSATSLLITFDGSSHTWEEVADNGFIIGSHDPKGDTLYGIDVCVRPKFRGRGIAGALYQARKKLVMELGLKRYIAGCRIPDYHKWKDELTVEEYVDNVKTGKLHDLVLSFMIRQGLQPLQIMPDYLEDDESLNYGVIVEWKNPTL